MYFDKIKIAYPPFPMGKGGVIGEIRSEWVMPVNCTGAPTYS